MARLPSSFRRRNITSSEFREQYAKLPKHIQELVRACCIKFNDNPQHRSLNWHKLKDRANAEHEPGSIAIRINMQYRAIFVQDGEINLWYWIGTHAEYDRFTGG